MDAQVLCILYNNCELKFVFSSLPNIVSSKEIRVLELILVSSFEVSLELTFDVFQAEVEEIEIEFHGKIKLFLIFGRTLQVSIYTVNVYCIFTYTLKTTRRTIGAKRIAIFNKLVTSENNSKSPVCV